MWRNPEKLLLIQTSEYWASFPLFLPLSLSLSVLRIEFRALHILGKHSTADFYRSPQFLLLKSSSIFKGVSRSRILRIRPLKKAHKILLLLSRERWGSKMQADKVN
jgi:hypothetical protein